MVKEREPIVFRVEIEDGIETVYAVMDWPEHSSISAELLATETQQISQNERGEIIITAANGTAVYKREAEQPSPYYVAVELVNSSWQPVPLLRRTQ